MGIVPSAEAEHEEVLDVIGKEHGYRVHHVEPGSPGAQAGLMSILDYVVVANGVRVDQEDGQLVDIIEHSKDAELRLCVFNTHTLRTRELTIVPNDRWGGKGLLGVTIRFDVLHSPDKHTLHVLEVYERSPASEARLDPYNDYIIAVGDLLFNGMNEFNDIIHHNLHREVRLYVYNAATEEVRQCTIVPNNRWGGEGVFGCALGAGYLHMLPQSRKRPPVLLPSAAADPAQLPPPPGGVRSGCDAGGSAGSTQPPPQMQPAAGADSQHSPHVGTPQDLPYPGAVPQAGHAAAPPEPVPVSPTLQLAGSNAVEPHSALQPQGGPAAGGVAEPPPPA